MPPSDFLSGILAPESIRSPRLLVLADGVPVVGASQAVVTSTGHFSADRFRVHAALSGDAAIWSARASAFIDVQMALSPLDGFVSLVQGNADLISIDPLHGTLLIEGRDLSAGLIEARTQENFANRTASEIAAILAARHGLAADVDATVTPVGRYWELEHNSLTLNVAGRSTTEWDLLVTLATHEAFNLWVSDGALHFRASDMISPPGLLRAAPAFDGPANLTSLRLDRTLIFAGDIVVTVKSWHSRAGTSCVQTAQTRRGATQSRSYVYVVPNLTPDAAQLHADNKLAELCAHELLLHAEMPGEFELWPRARVALLGTGTLFDTVYRIDEVERRLHATRGFSQILRARASSAPI